MGKYVSKLAQNVTKYTDLIREGYLLCIDPSSGSHGSVPGYAVFRKGKLEDMGVVELPRGNRHIANRLFLLRNTLEKSFEKPDILVVELISPIMPSGGGGWKGGRMKATGQLMKSVGAILSQWDAPVLEVSPITWHTMTPPGYVKDDPSDAAMLGNAVYITLARALGETEPEVQLPNQWIRR